MNMFLTPFLLFSTSTQAQETCPQLLRNTVETLVDHEPVNLCTSYSGKVVPTVNTASRCIYTTSTRG